MAYQVAAPSNPTVDAAAQTELQAFFDSIPGGVDNLPTFLQGVAATTGGSADVATSLYVLAELATGLATVGALGAVENRMTTAADFLVALGDALSAASL